jgi:hypothetical protein
LRHIRVGDVIGRHTSRWQSVENSGRYLRVRQVRHASRDGGTQFATVSILSVASGAAIFERLAPSGNGILSVSGKSNGKYRPQPVKTIQCSLTLTDYCIVRNRLFLARPLLLLLMVASLQGAESLTLQSPVEYQVFQRSTRETGVIAVRGHAAYEGGIFEARVGGDAWTALRFAGGEFSGEIPARAGGFFVVDISGTEWRIADDPQPGVQDNSSKGSFIPAFGDALYERLHVPIGIACVGHGSTSVRLWLPAGRPIATEPTMTKFVIAAPTGAWQSAGRLFDGILNRIRQFGPNGFRAILWHQGESDARADKVAAWLNR